MTTWWWVRHGPTHRKDMNGSTDVPADLSDSAALLRLRQALPAQASVLSSDLSRAVETANAIQGDRPRLPHDPALREIHFGAWEARSFAEVEAEDAPLIREFWERPGDLAAPDGESWNGLSTRVSELVDTLCGQHEHIVAVAHFGPILTQLQRALGCSAYEVLGHKIDNLSLTRLRFDGAWHAEVINHVP